IVSEFSIFCHGSMGSAILVNSEDSFKGLDARDPNDKDGRADKDFNDTNMPDDERPNFAAAFGPESLCWTWGCSFTYAFHDLLGKLLQSRRYSGLGRTQDTDVFTLTYTQAQARDY